MRIFDGAGVWILDNTREEPPDWCEVHVTRRRLVVGDELLVTIRGANGHRYEARLAEGERDVFAGMVNVDGGVARATIRRALWFLHASGRVAFYAKWGENGQLYPLSAILEEQQDDAVTASVEPEA
jgi:hypothetical protein